MLDCLQLAAVESPLCCRQNFVHPQLISDVYNANRNTKNFGAGLGHSVCRLGYCSDDRGTVV